MKKILIIMLLVGGIVASMQAIKPEFVKVNESIVNQCTHDMVNNPHLICD